MFISYFNFFLDCIKSVFTTMKKFTLFGGFSYFNFFLFLILIPIIFKLLSFIFGKESDK